jgi:hypothetical protein
MARTSSALRRTISLVVEATITLAAVAYFAIEGFSGNVALTVVLTIVGITSFVMLLGILLEGRRPQQ